MNNAYILRDNQKPPNEYWRFWSLIAGRGFGKTLAGSHCILNFIMENKKFSLGLMGATFKDVKNIMLDGPSGLLTLFHNYGIKYHIQWHFNKILINDITIYLFSAERYDNLRGFSLDCIWIDEIAKFSKPQETLNQLLLCCRKNEPQFIITSTPRPLSIWEFLKQQKFSFFTHGSSYDNNNLPDAYLDIITQWSHTPLGRQEIFGEIHQQNPSPWHNYKFQYKNYDNHCHYILSIDPAVSSHGNTTGIILLAQCNHEIIIVDDFSIQDGVDNWIQIIGKICDQYWVQTIVMEVNQGGDLLEYAIKNSYKQSIPIYKCFARHNKFSRSLSTAQLYWQNKIFHSKPLPILEQQLIQFNNEMDRIDALVWGVEYFIKNPIEYQSQWSIL